MTSKILAACLAAAIALPAVSLAQQAGPTVVAEAGKGVTATDTVTGRATITAIDAATRTATLKTESGEIIDMVVDPAVPNFDKLQVGDTVAATYTASLAARIAQPGEVTPEVKESVSAPQTAPGERKVAHEVTASLKVEAVDTKANTVTLSGPQGNKKTIAVNNPKVQERLKTVKVGDVVVVTYTESVALRLEKVPAK